ncbi:hypothetical protein D5R81_11235 [Parashewanella spongiae]|uniref:Uncharacterized protein n=1 Tax=Parashewanella spongiae TaxID=342950 RepID=A0A3A6U5I1_9GAMM|nr:hypothetical protein [Parashewanella spongiae]MCL1078525.1 hypothetical protein [Parashewanella spongiae]RJY13456.1 hypothetical protein D5R81_11235 [Parashewanella spongiae]
MSERMHKGGKNSQPSQKVTDLNSNPSFELLALSQLPLETFATYIAQHPFNPSSNIQLQLFCATSRLNAYSIHIGSWDTHKKASNMS